MHIPNVFLVLAILLGSGSDSTAQSVNATSGDAWKAMQSLVGQWDGDPGNQPGQATGGSFTISSELQGHVLLRRSFAEFAATPDRPASRHDDLTVIYPAAPGTPLRANYYDSEGHVIEYTISVSNGAHHIEWVSEIHPGEPRFRFTYDLTSLTTMKVRFEIAPPNQPDAFKTHVEGSVHKAGAK